MLRRSITSNVQAVLAAQLVGGLHAQRQRPAVADHRARRRPRGPGRALPIGTKYSCTSGHCGFQSVRSPTGASIIRRQLVRVVRLAGDQLRRR